MVDPQTTSPAQFRSGAPSISETPTYPLTKRFQSTTIASSPSKSPVRISPTDQEQHCAPGTLATRFTLEIGSSLTSMHESGQEAMDTSSPELSSALNQNRNRSAVQESDGSDAVPPFRRLRQGTRRRARLSDSDDMDSTAPRPQRQRRISTSSTGSLSPSSETSLSAFHQSQGTGDSELEESTLSEHSTTSESSEEEPASHQVMQRPRVQRRAALNAVVNLSRTPFSSSSWQTVFNQENERIQTPVVEEEEEEETIATIKVTENKTLNLPVLPCRLEDEQALLLLIAKYLAQSPFGKSAEPLIQAMLPYFPTHYNFMGQPTSNATANSVQEMLTSIPADGLQTLFSQLRHADVLQNGTSHYAMTPVDYILSSKRLVIPDPVSVFAKQIYLSQDVPQPHDLYAIRARTWRSAFSPIEPPSLYRHYYESMALIGHTQPVFCVLVDYTGTRLITGGDDTLLKIWHSETGHLLYSCRGHSAVITDIDLSPCNVLIASGSQDKTIRIWKLATGEHLQVLKAGASIATILFHPLFDSKSDQPGTGLITTGGYGFARTWCWLNPEKLFHPIPIQHACKVQSRDSVRSASFTRGGTRFMTGGTDGILRCHRVPSAENYLNQDHHQQQHALESIELCQFRGYVTDIVCNYKGDLFASVSMDGTVRVWSVSENGKHYENYVLDMNDEKSKMGPIAAVITSTAPATTETTPKRIKITMIAWMRNDQVLVTTSKDHLTRTWQHQTLLQCHSYHEHDTYILQSHPKDARLMLSACLGGRITLFEPLTGRLIQRLDCGPQQSFLDGHFSPCGRLFALVDMDGKCTVFRLGCENGVVARMEQFLAMDFVPLDYDTHLFPLLDESTLTAPRRILDAMGNDQGEACDPTALNDTQFHNRTIPYQALKRESQWQFWDKSASTQKKKRRVKVIYGTDSDLDETNAMQQDNATNNAMNPPVPMDYLSDRSDATFEVTENHSHHQPRQRSTSRTRTRTRTRNNNQRSRSNRQRRRRLPSSHSLRQQEQEEQHQQRRHSSRLQQRFSTRQQHVLSSDESEMDHEMASQQRKARAERRQQRMNSNVEETHPDPVESQIPAAEPFPDWMSSHDTLDHFFVPQIGDVVAYFRQGHCGLDTSLDRNVHYEEVMKAEIEEMKYEKRRNEIYWTATLSMGQEKNSQNQVVSSQSFHRLRQTHSMSLSTRVEVSIPWHWIRRLFCLWQRYEWSQEQSWMFGQHVIWFPLTANGQESVVQGTILSSRRHHPFDHLQVEESVTAQVHWLGGWQVALSDEVEGTIKNTSPFKTNALLKEWTRFMHQSDAAIPFLFPVDTTVYPNYPLVIAYPLDASLLENRLKNGYYRRVSHFVWEVRKMLENAQIYNKRKSEIWWQAEQVKEWLEADLVPLTVELTNTASRTFTSSQAKSSPVVQATSSSAVQSALSTVNAASQEHSRRLRVSGPRAAVMQRQSIQSVASLAATSHLLRHRPVRRAAANRVHSYLEDASYWEWDEMDSDKQTRQSSRQTNSQRSKWDKSEEEEQVTVTAHGTREERALKRAAMKS